MPPRAAGAATASLFRAAATIADRSRSRVRDARDARTREARTRGARASASDFGGSSDAPKDPPPPRGSRVCAANRPVVKQKKKPPRDTFATLFRHFFAPPPPLFSSTWNPDCLPWSSPDSIRFSRDFQATSSDSIPRIAMKNRDQRLGEQKSHRQPPAERRWSSRGRGMAFGIRGATQLCSRRSLFPRVRAQRRERAARRERRARRTRVRRREGKAGSSPHARGPRGGAGASAFVSLARVRLSRARSTGTPRADSSAEAPAMAEPASTAGASGAAGDDGRGGASPAEWECPHCTLLNESSSSLCAVCSNPRPRAEEDRAADEPPVTAPDGMWCCGVCTYHNAAFSSRCVMCTQVRPTPRRDPRVARVPRTPRAKTRRPRKDPRARPRAETPPDPPSLGGGAVFLSERDDGTPAPETQRASRLKKSLRALFFFLSHPPSSAARRLTITASSPHPHG